MKIIGESKLTSKQMAKFLLKYNSNPKINAITAEELCGMFLDEGKIENVRGDIAFCQSCLETGFFKYEGLVLPEQNNYAGIGAVNNSRVGKGAWFNTPQIGIRAQIQHLKAYASTEKLVKEIVDPRFDLVKRGIAPNWKDLNGKWAYPGIGYGQNILKLYDKILKDEEIIDDEEILEIDKTKILNSIANLEKELELLKNIINN